MQYCSSSSVLAMELLRSWAKPSIDFLVSYHVLVFFEGLGLDLKTNEWYKKQIPCFIGSAISLQNDTAYNELIELNSYM